MRFHRAPVHLRIWFYLFLAVTLFFDLKGGTNPDSRFAGILGFIEHGNPRIDSYEHYSIDWAKTPDGHYYSNKAPGPALLGLPLTWMVDSVANFGVQDKAIKDKRRDLYRFTLLKVLSLLFQVIPFLLVSALLIEWLQEQQVSQQALLLSTLALLYGTTATLFMNTYFGHGMAAVAFLFLIWALLREKFVWAGFFTGFGLLADYGSAFVIPILFGHLLISRQWKKAFPIIIGALVPAVFWIGYHTYCFGSPFTLPGKYQNPLFVESSRHAIWGIIGLIPNPKALFELVLGKYRGLLFTQPWVLFICFLSLYYLKSLKHRWLFGFVLLTQLCLLIMNAAFGNYHGGSTPGPRYLSASLPAFALLLGLLYDQTPIWIRRVLWGSVLVSVVFFLLVYSTELDAKPAEVLWVKYLRLVTVDGRSTTWFRFSSITAIFAWVSGRQIRLIKRL